MGVSRLLQGTLLQNGKNQAVQNCPKTCRTARVAHVHLSWDVRWISLITFPSLLFSVRGNPFPVGGLSLMPLCVAELLHLWVEEDPPARGGLTLPHPLSSSHPSVFTSQGNEAAWAFGGGRMGLAWLHLQTYNVKLVSNSSGRVGSAWGVRNTQRLLHEVINPFPVSGAHVVPQ